MLKLWGMRSTLSLPSLLGLLWPGVVALQLVVRLVTVVEGDPKVPFSIATTPRCRERRNSFPWITPLYP